MQQWLLSYFFFQAEDGIRYRLVGAGGLHVGSSGRQGEVPGLRARRLLRGDRRALAHRPHLFGRGKCAPGRRLYAELDRGRRRGRHLVVRRLRRRERHHLRRVRAPHHRRSALRLRSGPALATTLPRHRPPHLGQPRLVPAAQGPEAGRSLSMRGMIERIDKALLAALCCIVVLLLGGALYSRNFLSLDYLLQQLQVASFLGVIATGAMLVILLGHIDLSIPWVVTTGGMMSTAAAGHGGIGGALAIPFALACGLGGRPINGIRVAYLRGPSMIFTLAINAIAQGLMVVHTSGFAPQEHATPDRKSVV